MIPRRAARKYEADNVASMPTFSLYQKQVAEIEAAVFANNVASKTEAAPVDISSYVDSDIALTLRTNDASDVASTIAFVATRTTSSEIVSNVALHGASATSVDLASDNPLNNAFDTAHSTVMVHTSADKDSDIGEDLSEWEGFEC